MSHILVIGGTGTVGSQVLSQLGGTDMHVRALVRNPGVARLPREVEVVRGDLTVPETLDPCLDGIDTGSWFGLPRPPLLLLLWRGS